MTLWGKQKKLQYMHLNWLPNKFHVQIPINFIHDH